MKKTCNKCKVEKEITEFYKHKTGLFGVKGICKPCYNKVEKEKRDANPEKELAKCARYRKENKEKERLRHKKYGQENKEKLSIYGKQYRLVNEEKEKLRRTNWFIKNRQKKLEANRTWLKENPEKAALIRKTWVKTNPDKIYKYRKTYLDKHPELLQNLEDRIKFRDYLAPVIFKRDTYTCSICNLTSCELRAHHISPWAEDEENRFNEQNIITLCKNCHYKTHNNGKWSTINEDITNQLKQLIEAKYDI